MHFLYCYSYQKYNKPNININVWKLRFEIVADYQNIQNYYTTKKTYIGMNKLPSLLFN